MLFPTCVFWPRKPDFKFRHIGKKCETYSYSNMMYQEAIMSDSQTCAICISYSGVSNEAYRNY